MMQLPPILCCCRRFSYVYRRFSYVYRRLSHRFRWCHTAVAGYRTWVGGREKSRSYGPASDRCPAASNSPVCSRVIPVCQHRSVRSPLGVPTSAINQTMSVAAKMSCAQRTQPKNIHHSAEFFPRKQTADYCHIAPRSPMMFSFVAYVPVYLSNCVVYYHFLWLGRESSWLVVYRSSNSVSHPLVFAHERISLPKLSGFYCTHYRTPETPNGPTPLYCLLSVIIHLLRSIVFLYRCRRISCRSSRLSHRFLSVVMLLSPVVAPLPSVITHPLSVIVPLPSVYHTFVVGNHASAVGHRIAAVGYTAPRPSVSTDPCLRL